MKPPEPAPELPRFAELETDFEILEELGRGGTAVVYLARERDLGRTVAIKVIRSTYIEDQEAAARLEREARTVGKLQHPNIVVLYGTRRLRDSSLALIMQYVPGRTLKSEVRAHGPMPIERVTQVLDEIGRALAHAHRHRIVHRDIKPENIFLDEETGIARLSDFGIARSWDGDSNLTLPGSAIGTPTYMSPEQVEGGVLDGRSDIYSLGLIGYEMLTGEPPWAGENLFTIIYSQKNEALPSLEARRPGIPAPLLLAIEGALRKDPAERWASAQDFLAALHGSLPPALPPQSSSLTAPGVLEEGGAAEGVSQADRESIEDNVTVRYRRPDEDDPDPEGTDPASLGGNGRLAGRGGTPRRRALIVTGALTVLIAGALAATALNQRTSGRWSNGTAAAALADTGPPPPLADVDEAEGAALHPSEPTVGIALEGDLQEGVVGDTLPRPLVVRVVDAAGQPVRGSVVHFAVRAGEGRLSPDSAATDPSGTASAWFVPLALGHHTVEVLVDGEGGRSATFSARALPLSPSRFAAVSPAAVQGEPGAPVPLMVRVEDHRGRPLAGVPVRFAPRVGGGLIQPESSTTDSDGVARVDWVLGSGAQEAVATVSALPGANVVFRASTGPAPLAVRPGLAVGGTHSCSLAGDGSVACWGGNGSGQLGDGTTVRRLVPLPVTAGESLASLAAGVSHTCGVAVSGTALCWGANASGQLGDGTRDSRPVPTRVLLEGRLVDVAVGNGHSCALDAAGSLQCWGQNTHGQLGNGTRNDRLTPAPVGGIGSVTGLALGWAHSCGLSAAGDALCWGSNGSGEVGDGTTLDRTRPVRVAGGHRFEALAAGSANTCGLRPDGRVLCWGAPLGVVGGEPLLRPVIVDAGEAFSALVVGGAHACALARDGSAWCWGRNTYGQLGDGTTEDQSRPVPVEGGHRFAALHAGGAHTCGATASGQRYCWGFNADGQLGDGTRENRTRPVPVSR